MCLPLLVVTVVAVIERVLLGSLSESYHHRYANSLFIGSMCAFAAFLWAYNYTRREDRLGNYCAAAAAGVAVFSTVPPAVVLLSNSVDVDGVQRAYTVAPPNLLDHLSGVVHFVCAFALFALLSRFCVLWRRDAQGLDRLVYSLSARIIWVGLGGALITAIIERLPALTDAPFALRLNSTAFLFFEILMVEAFGLAWLVRGDADPRRASWAAGSALGAATAIMIVFSVGHASSVSMPAPPAGVFLSAGIGLAAVVAVLAFLWPDRPTVVDRADVGAQSA